MRYLITLPNDPTLAAIGAVVGVEVEEVPTYHFGGPAAPGWPGKKGRTYTVADEDDGAP